MGVNEASRGPVVWRYESKVERLPGLWASWPGRFEMPPAVAAACRTKPALDLNGNRLPSAGSEDTEEPEGANQPVGSASDPNSDKPELEAIGEKPAQHNADE